MKQCIFLAATMLLAITASAQQAELNFTHQRTNLSTTQPRTAISPMSLKLWDNYDNGGPTTYGTVLEIYGLHAHQTSQLYFGGWDNSKIRYREAFYGDVAWSNWITMLDSKNNVESAGSLMVSGAGTHFINGGNVGIGTSTPTERLSVNGKIRAKEIKVEAGNWPDYVFENDYKLPSLIDLERYVRENKRLPEIPSAKEVEANGVELGEMNKLLLKKMEEFTLLLIDQSKKIAKQDETINKLAKQLADLNKR